MLNNPNLNLFYLNFFVQLKNNAIINARVESHSKIPFKDDFNSRNSALETIILL